MNFTDMAPLNEFIIDFYCRELRLAIEIDSNTHDYNYVKDDKRQKKLEKMQDKVSQI